MNCNSVHGKTIETLRDRVDIRLATNAKDYQVSVNNRPSSISQKIFNENLVPINKTKEVLRLNEPSYAGVYI